MTHNRWWIALLASTFVVCGPSTTELVHRVDLEADRFAEPDAPVYALTDLFLRVVGTRDGTADLKYPCESALDVCLPVHADGTVEPLVDLCPTVDSGGGTGTWSFTYALYTDAGCHTPADLTCASTSGETITTGTTVNNVACTYVATARIGDFVWEDLDHDGIQDAGEPGIAGVTVQLWNADHTVLIATQVTDGTGHYLFANLTANTYQVDVIGPTGYTATTPNAPGSTTANDSNPRPTTVTVATGESNLTIDFGYYTTTPAKEFTVANVTMEGAITFPWNSWISGGYHFKFISGTHLATTFTVHSVMHMYVACQGTTSPVYDVVVDLGTQTYAIPANDTNYWLSAAQNVPASYMGAMQAPNLCAGGNLVNSAATGGVTFVTTVSQSPASGSLVDFQFHYRVPAGKGKADQPCTTDAWAGGNVNYYRDVCSASWSNTVRDP